ncbi:hypothetical protein [Roseomonas gilardii]|uniref:hypothetical protein n=1 Tax=Roseomonas gilardii TaxID=257708 RepID=UPI0004B7772B|nr:hypothetical protein [Roseomonas gilardii]SUE63091.1 Uncharacterised protein [Roseomonas gilardii subsp. rosea]
MAAGQERAFGGREVGQGMAGKAGRRPEPMEQQQAYRPRAQPLGGIEAKQQAGQERSLSKIHAVPRQSNLKSL